MAELLRQFVGQTLGLPVMGDECELAQISGDLAQVVHQL